MLDMDACELTASSKNLNQGSGSLGIELFCDDFDLSSSPDFSLAVDTGLIITADFEKQLKKKVGYSIAVGNEQIKYSRTRICDFSGIKSSQMSKIINGEAWMSLDALGRWGFATGVMCGNLIKCEPISASPLVRLVWFSSGRLHNHNTYEFELVLKYISSRYCLPYTSVAFSGEEIVPNLGDPQWTEKYSYDYYSILGKHIGKLRKYLHMSTRRMAEIIQVSPETIKRYESGDHRISKGLFSAYRLCMTLNVKPMELVKGTLHHKLKYTQIKRQHALVKMFSSLPVSEYGNVKKLLLAVGNH